MRATRVPYVAVDEAKKTLLPGGAFDPGEHDLKSFDFVVYGSDTNLLVDVKGRKVTSPTRLESWVTEEDVASLTRWRALFGSGFEAVFVFAYWCDRQPPDPLFQEVMSHRGRWYALRAVTVDRYRTVMKPRSERWRTVHVPGDAFERVSGPFSLRSAAERAGGLPHELPALQSFVSSLGSSR